MMYHTTSKVMVNGKHGHLFFSYHEHIINNIRADPDYRGANAAIRRQLKAELQAIQTVLSNNEPTVNHTSDVEPGLSSSNSTLPTQEQPTTTNIDTGAIAHNILRISNRGAKATPMTMQQLIVITLRKRVQNTELTIPMMDIQERKINPTPLQQHIQYVENRLKLM